MAKNQDYGYVREYYKVPAERGALVRYKGFRLGRITHAGGHYVYITWRDSGRELGPYHPTDELEYLEAEILAGADQALGPGGVK